MVERRVDMVRLEREDVYDREEVLGRDATSVFPKQSKAATLASASAGQLDADAIREMLGARRFVTEKELDSIKKQRGESVDDGTAAAPLKPLVEVLREAKEQKEASFAAKWKQMKTGKNRPLDAEELDFLDNLAEAEAARLRVQQAEEAAELAEFRQGRAQQQAEGEQLAGPPGVTAAAGPEADPVLPQPHQEHSAAAATKVLPKKAIPPVRPLLRAVVKGKTGSGKHVVKEAGEGSEAANASKRQRLEAQQPAGEEDVGGGLPGLLGYSSESEE